MSLPRAVLLDLDDTILDDSTYIVRLWRETCLDHADRLEGLEAAALHDAIERVRAWYWGDAERHRVGRLDMAAATREVVGMALAELGATLPDVAESISTSYRARRDASIAPFPGAIDTVRWLREQGCRLALLTNGAGPAQRIKIDRFELAPLFDTVLVEGELGFGKPDPRVYEKALSDLGVGPQDAWMVGDNLVWDVGSPQRLGIVGIWVDRWGRGLHPGTDVVPDRIIRHLAELRDPA